MATRRERVVLDLTDNLTPGLARAAVAAKDLDGALDGVNNRSVTVARSVNATAPAFDRMGSSATRAGNALDSFSGRTGIMLDLLLALGPAAVATGAMAAPALTTIASGVGAVGVAAVGTAVAFGGVGEAIETMNKAHLDPTKENLKEARVAMERLAPAAQGFVKQLDSMRALGMEIRDAGQQGLFPGLTDALEALERRGPDAVRIIEKINREVGDLARDGARSLAGPRWDDFFRMIERQAPRALDTMGRALGDVLHGVSEIMEAFAPTSRGGLEWIADAANSFDRWATGLKRSDDFRQFIDYVREVGPQVADTAGAIAQAVGDIATAAAPLGGVALQGLEGLANAASAIAGSGMGTELLVAAGAIRTMQRVGGLTGISGPGGVIAAARAGGPGAALSVATGVVPVFVTNPGFGGAGVPGVVGGSPSGRGGFGKIARSVPFLGTALAVSEVARNEVNSPDYKPGLVGGGILGSGVNRSVAEISPVVDDAAAAKVRAEIEKITAKPYTASVDLEDQRARRVAQGVHRMLDDVASQKPTPKIDADPAPATGKTNGVKRLLDEVGNKRPKPRIDAQDGASPVINRVSGLLASLDGRNASTTITTTYVTRRVNEGTGAGFGASDFGVADGGTVRGGRAFRAAGGGTVPKSGRSYADRYPYLLADGEEVISNRYGQADRHRDLLKAINAGRLADGGTARAVASAMRGASHASRVNVAAPSVSVGGPAVRVFIDGKEVRAVVRSEMNAQDRWEREQARD